MQSFANPGLTATTKIHTKKNNFKNEDQSKCNSKSISVFGLSALLKVVNESERENKKSLSKEVSKIICWNKLCAKTRTDQVKWSHKKIHGNYVWLCDKCSDAYSKNNYCKYCKEIYGNLNKRNSYWIQCKSCKRWTHKNCEEKFGKQKNIKALLLNSSFTFYCDECKNIINDEEAKSESDWYFYTES